MKAITSAQELSIPPTGFGVAAMTAAASAPGKPAATAFTRASNAAWLANGPASHTRSSSEQPSARSGLSALRDQPFGQASGTTGIVSVALAPSASPPPETVGALVSVAAAELATLTVIVTGG